MRLTRVRTISVVALLGAALTIPTGAMAGLPVFVSPSEPYDRAVPTFDYDLPTQECLDPTFAVYDQEGYFDDETRTRRDDAGLQVTTGQTSTSGTFVVPGLEGGQYMFEVQCGPAEEPSTFPTAFSFRRLTVDKVVEGDVPDGTTFTVQVVCTPSPGSDFEFEEFTVDLDYDADGGSGPVIIYDPFSDVSCTIEETDDGGAESVTVEPDEVVFVDGVFNASSTVTNTFPAPEPTPTATETPTETPSPTPTPTPTQTETPSPTPTPTDDDVVDDDVEEAAPATPVPAQPTYTG